MKRLSSRTLRQGRVTSSLLQNSLETILRYRMVFPATDDESFEAYRAMIRPVFDVSMPASGLGPRFSNQVDTSVLDGVIVSHSQGTALVFERTQDTILRGGLDEIIVVTYLRGHHRCDAGDGARRVSPGQLVVLDLSRPVRIEADDYENVSLLISRRAFEERMPPPYDIHGMVLGEGVVSSLLVHHMRRLGDAALVIPQAEASAIGGVTLDLVLACVRQWAGRHPEPAHGAVTVSAIRAAIEQQLANPALGPAVLMQQFGLSRPTLYRLFEQRGGVTAYITERRLRRAFRIVTDPSAPTRSIAQLARLVGFTSSATFGRAFRALFGLTPSQARALAWRPLDPSDSPWRLPPIAQRFAVPLEPQHTAALERFVSDR